MKPLALASWLAGLIGDALRIPRKPDIPPAMKDPFHTYIAYEAEKHIGLHESGGANKGEQLAPIFAADNYDPNGPKPGDDGYPWCAAFVCFVVKRAMEEHGGRDVGLSRDSEGVTNQPRKPRCEG